MELRNIEFFFCNVFLQSADEKQDETKEEVPRFVKYKTCLVFVHSYRKYEHICIYALNVCTRLGICTQVHEVGNIYVYTQRID